VRTPQVSGVWLLMIVGILQDARVGVSPIGC
jgi:hypothetical protein